ncbi:hypothetical protein E2542_SST25840 [Spatholobus suberectus]|nr:hypothetical protein E2542_SST25840 [Spatholobus suberectus]
MRDSRSSRYGLLYFSPCEAALLDNMNTFVGRIRERPVVIRAREKTGFARVWRRDAVGLLIPGNTSEKRTSITAFSLCSLHFVFSFENITGAISCSYSSTRSSFRRRLKNKVPQDRA